MEKLHEQFKEATKSVALTQEEKATMREKLVLYMEYKPIRGAFSAHEHSLIERFSIPFFRAHHFSGALLIAAVVASSTFGVSFAAEDSLPGDLLYNIKVNINEEIKTVFLSSDESRITWERERAERRLVEASQLEAEGRLDDEKQQKVSELFAEHTNAVVEQVRAVEESDPVFAAEMSSMLEDSLDAHEAVLARLIVEQENGSDEGARELVAQVRTVAMEVEKIRNDAEEKIAIDEGELTNTEDVEDVQSEPTEVTSAESNTESVNLRVRAAYRAQERANNLFAEVKELEATLEPESELAEQARVQIAFGEELVRSGETSLKENNLGDAYGKFRKASASLQKVLQLLEVATLFSIEIYPDKESVTQTESDIQEIKHTEIPEDEDVLQELQSTRVHIQNEIATALKLLLTQEGHNDTDVEKANNRIKDALSHLMRAEIAVVLKDYADAMELFEQAEKLTAETVRILEVAGQEDGVNDIPVFEVPQNDTDPIEPAKEPQSETRILNHLYKDGKHTYTGSITLQSPCHTLERTAFVAESFPEQIRVDLIVKDPEPGTMCI
ncbi:MAG: hypothetical protein UV60_C0026G0011, partial [Parcubacteria group bacterium GW2011_GWA2_43_11]